jgi:hypothetical protein
MAHRTADEAGTTLNKVARIRLSVAARTGKATESFDGGRLFGGSAAPILSNVDDQTTHGG